MKASTVKKPEFHFVKSRGSGLKLIHNGYTFYKHYTSIDGVTSWRCKAYKCMLKKRKLSSNKDSCKSTICTSGEGKSSKLLQVIFKIITTKSCKQKLQVYGVHRCAAPASPVSTANRGKSEAPKKCMTPAPKKTITKTDKPRNYDLRTPKKPQAMATKKPAAKPKGVQLQTKPKQKKAVASRSIIELSDVPARNLRSKSRAQTQLPKPKAGYNKLLICERKQRSGCVGN